MKNNSTTIIIVSVIVALALGFGGGMYFQKNNDSLNGVTGTALQKKLSSLGMTTGGFGAGANGVAGAAGGYAGRAGFIGRGGAAGGGIVAGSVISVGSNSLTIKEASGSTKTVYYTSSTTVSKQVTGSMSDVTVGQNVTASGTANSDGSVAATTIQIRPAGSTTTPVPPTVTQ